MQYIAQSLPSFKCYFSFSRRPKKCVFWKSAPAQTTAWMSLWTWWKESVTSYLLPALPRRRSRCGGKGTWCGRACPIRPPSPRRGSRARLPRRALWSKRPRRRAARGPRRPERRQASDIWAKQLFAPAGMKKGGCHAVTQCVNWNSVRGAAGVASGRWSIFLIIFFVSPLFS